jgi:hypothetical protein
MGFVGMTAQRDYDLDWTDVSGEMAERILKQGELFLESQLKIGLAADQRAMVSAGIFAAFSASLVAATTAFISQHLSIEAAGAGYASAAMLLIGSIVCARSARPQPFGHAGSQPKMWWDIRAQNDTAAAIGAESEDYQVRIEHNEKTLAANARNLVWGLRIGMSAPVVGALISGCLHLACRLGYLPPWS